MAHELEIIDGVAQIAYAKEAPWHKLGTKVPNDLTPAQMLKAAGLDWKVKMTAATSILYADKKILVDLLDEDDNVVLDKSGKPKKVEQIVDDTDKLIAEETIDSGVLWRLPNGRNIKKASRLTEVRNREDWHPTQNDEAMDFFHEFVMKGDMDMDVAGSLYDGQIMWALAKIKESFTVCGKKDRIDSYLLFSNPHQYGKARNIRFTPIRVVCNNTLTWSLGENSKNAVTSNHRRSFNAAEVKEKLGLAHVKMEDYKERAQFLASKQCKGEDIVDYFKRVFPMGKQKEDSKRAPKELHKAASLSMAILKTQPGADIAPGTFWNAFNAATFYIDHLYGRTDTSRLQNAWFGSGESKKKEALNIALEMATKAA